MKKIFLLNLSSILFFGCHKQIEHSKIPVKLSLLVVTPYEERFEKGYAFEANIFNNQKQNIVLLSPTITIEKLEKNGKWLYIFKSTPNDYMNRDKFYPNEGREREGFKKYNFNDTISKEVLKVLNLPINNKNLLEINNYSVYMTFLKKDSVFTFSNTMNNVLNIGIRFLSHETLKGKYRAFCKIDKERLFHSIKLWNEKNERSEYDLPKYWGKFKFIENPTIKSDTIYFEIY